MFFKVISSLLVEKIEKMISKWFYVISKSLDIAKDKKIVKVNSLI